MAKFPIILESGRADGKLVTTNSIFDENKGIFQSELNDIQDTLNSNNPNKPLSAKQGKILKELLDAKVIEAGDVPIDAEPTEGNTSNVVNSDGIYKALSKKVNNVTFEERNKNQDVKLFELDLKSVRVSSFTLPADIPSNIKKGHNFYEYSIIKGCKYRIKNGSSDNLIIASTNAKTSSEPVYVEVFASPFRPGDELEFIAEKDATYLYIYAPYQDVEGFEIINFTSNFELGNKIKKVEDTVLNISKSLAIDITRDIYKEDYVKLIFNQNSWVFARDWNSTAGKFEAQEGNIYLIVGGESDIICAFVEEVGYGVPVVFTGDTTAITVKAHEQVGLTAPIGSKWLYIDTAGDAIILKQETAKSLNSSIESAIQKEAKEREDDINQLDSIKIPKPSVEGTKGQQLLSNGDGTTIWADYDTSLVETTIKNWLDEHPEATSTIQDGSLTWNKFKKEQIGFVTPEMFYEESDGNDWSNAFQKAIDYTTAHRGMYLRLSGYYTITRTINVNGDLALLGINTPTPIRYGEGISDSTYMGPSQIYFTCDTCFNLLGYQHSGEKKGCASIYLRNICVLSTGEGHGVFIDDSAWGYPSRPSIIESCNFWKMHTVLRVDGESFSSYTSLYNIIIRNNHVKQTKFAINCVANEGIGGIIIENNVIEQGVGVKLILMASYCKIENNLIEAGGDWDILTRNGSIVFKGNYAEDFEGNITFHTLTKEKIEFSDNYFTHVTKISSTDSYTIKFLGMTIGDFSGNHFNSTCTEEAKAAGKQPYDIKIEFERCQFNLSIFIPFINLITPIDQNYYVFNNPTYDFLYDGSEIICSTQGISTRNIYNKQYISISNGILDFTSNLSYEIGDIISFDLLTFGNGISSIKVFNKSITPVYDAGTSGIGAGIGIQYVRVEVKAPSSGSVVPIQIVHKENSGVYLGKMRNSFAMFIG